MIKPRLHFFTSTGEAYDASQTRDEITDGDILIVPSENVIGFLYEAWPSVLNGTPERGAFHELASSDGTFLADKPQYGGTLETVRALMPVVDTLGYVNLFDFTAGFDF